MTCGYLADLSPKTMIFKGPVESFFKTPCQRPAAQGDGILFHLRRDLEKLYGHEDVFAGDTSAHAMLAMMGLLAGIDYLSRVYSSQNSSRQRFVDTLKCLRALDSDAAEALYQFRCALVHSISLSTVSDCSYRRGTRFTFAITDQDGTALITNLSDDGKEAAYEINFWELKRCFIIVIDRLFDICTDRSHPRHLHVIKMVGQLHSEKLIKK